MTGAGGGLGRTHALDLAARGAKVVVNDLGGTIAGDEPLATADDVRRHIARIRDQDGYHVRATFRPEAPAPGEDPGAGPSVATAKSEAGCSRWIGGRDRRSTGC
ncbi:MULTISPECIES: hypothetical protein [Pseudofrankia]|uniref:hypothetical protein n=1 Tax=Pseudofrankia TaxID=2994363 RepID=UPI000234B221|nr:hypothetical protein BCD49_13325 [Pseudofrankia sp. EUN1h]